MEQRYVIGLDFGTKSGRAILAATQNGDIKAASSADYPHGVMDQQLPDGTLLKRDWALQHPKDYLDVMETTVRTVLKQAGVSSGQVIGISLDFTASTVLPVDEHLIPLCMKIEFADHPHAYVKLWKHHAAQKQADRINDYLATEGLIDLPKFGGRISSEILLPKILQIIEEDFDIYAASAQILEASDWICQLLTGETRRTQSTAAYKAMWDEKTGYPDSNFFKGIHPALEGVAQEKLWGDVVPVGSRFGTLTADWAGRLGLKTGIAVGCGIIDAHAGLPGCGITRPGQMLLVLGTSSVQTMLSKVPYAKKGICGSVKGGIMPGYYALESGLAAVGDVLDWFAGNCTPGICECEARNRGISVQQILTEKASHLTPGQTGLIALDWWNGNKTPYVDATRSGLILGCTLTTRPEDIYRALIESTAFGTRLIMETFEQAGNFTEEIIACGGITHKNPLMMQIYADVLNKEIKISASDETPALGSAMYAAVAAGPEAGGYATIFEAAENMSCLESYAYNPIKEYVVIYESLYQEYLSLVNQFAPALHGCMEKLKAFSQP